jgi:hypothetical protein
MRVTGATKPRSSWQTGIDPGAVRKAQKAAKQERAANSFEVVALEWFNVWKSKVAPLRGCLQSFQQEAQEGQMYELQADIEQTFGVFPQSSGLFKPAK